MSEETEPTYNPAVTLILVIVGLVLIVVGQQNDGATWGMAVYGAGLGTVVMSAVIHFRWRRSQRR